MIPYDTVFTLPIVDTEAEIEEYANQFRAIHGDKSPRWIPIDIQIFDKQSARRIWVSYVSKPKKKTGIQ